MALELSPGGVLGEQRKSGFQAVKVGIGAQVSTANEPGTAAPLTTILHPHQPLSRTCSPQRASQAQSGRVDSGQLGSPEFSFSLWPGRRWISFPLKYFTDDCHEASYEVTFLLLAAQAL